MDKPFAASHRISLHLAWRQLGRDFRAGGIEALDGGGDARRCCLERGGLLSPIGSTTVSRATRGNCWVATRSIASDQPSPASFAAKAVKWGSRFATTATFPSMGRAPDDKGGATRLVGVKAVSAGYPLRGQMRLSTGQGSAVQGRGAGRPRRARCGSTPRCSTR